MERLIYEIQKRNVLWNKRNPNYKDRIINDREWEAVAGNVQLSKEDCKKKWRNLRDMFAKELKKLPQSRSGDPQQMLYTGKWQYFNAMLFLKDSCTPRVTEGNVPMQSNDSVEPESEVCVLSQDDLINNSFESNIDYVRYETNSEAGDMSEQEENNRITNPKAKKRKLENSHIEALIDMEKKKLQLLENPDDPNLLFLKSLLPYFEKMDPIQQLRVRSKIQNVILEELTAKTTV